ncbi:MAG: hypothetical protein JWM80_5460 [Cyanobacteria bacterium RYN_339]|nr:hypothetical protein [Cyanobacteria bacterium RYN_339]
MRLRHFVLSAFVACTLGGCYQAIGVAFASGLLAALAMPEFYDYQAKAREADVRANAHAVKQAIQVWALDHDGEFPPLANWADTLAKSARYLPAAQLPGVGYGDTRVWQGTSLVLSDAPIQLKGPGDPDGPTQVGTVLGPGKAPSTMAFDALTYGALIYGVDTKRRAFVLYGVSERKGKAVVACALTN